MDGMYESLDAVLDETACTTILNNETIGTLSYDECKVCGFKWEDEEIDVYPVCMELESGGSKFMTGYIDLLSSLN